MNEEIMRILVFQTLHKKNEELFEFFISKKIYHQLFYRCRFFANKIARFFDITTVFLLNSGRLFCSVNIKIAFSDSNRKGILSNEIVFFQCVNKAYNPCREYWQLAKEPADYLFSSAKYYETGIKDFVFLKDLRDEF